MGEGGLNEKCGPHMGRGGPIDAKRLKFGTSKWKITFEWEGGPKWTIGAQKRPKMPEIDAKGPKVCHMGPNSPNIQKMFGKSPKSV